MRQGLIVDLHMILTIEGQTLLMRRANTGFEDGKYGVPSGHLEPGERPITGALRELKEELGIEALAADLSLIHLMHNRSNSDRMAMFFQVTKWVGTPVNNEPHKCDELVWLAKNDLSDQIIPYIRAALQSIEQGKTYSEFGGEDAISDRTE